MEKDPPGRKYGPSNLERMQRGLAPQVEVLMRHRKRGLITRRVSMGIHHNFFPQRTRSKLIHEHWNLEIATPWGHAKMNRYRHIGYEPLKIVRGANRR